MSPVPHSMVYNEPLSLHAANHPMTSSAPSFADEAVTSAELEQMDSNQQPLWIFGYGSLMWNPGFQFDRSSRAYIHGYSRHFSQGNAGCRGTEESPARVATIEHDELGTTPGLLFRVTDVRAALEHLERREIDNGYEYIRVRAHLPNDAGVITAITCISHRRHMYLGRLRAQSLPDVAYRIATTQGPTGLENAEYVLKCAHYTRKLFPAFHDEHMDRLELFVLRFRRILNLAEYHFS